MLILLQPKLIMLLRMWNAALSNGSVIGQGVAAHNWIPKSVPYSRILSSAAVNHTNAKRSDGVFPKRRDLTSLVPKVEINDLGDMENGDLELKCLVREMQHDFMKAPLDDVLKDSEFSFPKHSREQMNKEHQELGESDEEYQEEVDDTYYGVDLDLSEDREIFALRHKRGERGVFDIDDLVVELQKENARDICVIQVPAEKNYCDYLVIVSGLSPRHLRAMAEAFTIQYKQRRWARDPKNVRIEGEGSSDWKVIDFGNIVLHMMMPTTREVYDIEMLWSVGEEHDDKCNEKLADIWSDLPDLTFLKDKDDH
ncbi:PREDICTED: uncharacterized protein LOC106821103 isoform X2 [Priapulus caudatus]|uniref:Uncharacterized protein LOC106821103 isoform X2 n=1 Tax=Priapulus caudatus TaxID=37621 RepID=A0ABM1F9Y1_PRICU|nr:PREDICTED: uncharacterized protein LOC106821103 isoform X2 [Priapulus caudatus]